MAVQRRNDEMADLLAANFLPAKFPIMVYGAFSGFCLVELNDVDTTARVVIPDEDAIDLKRGLRYMVVVRDSGNGLDTGTGQLGTSSSASIYDDGVDICTLRTNADGSVDVRRTAGSATFDVLLLLMWI